MSRFIYIADTHAGAAPAGAVPMEYQQQKGYPERAHEVLAALAAWIAAQGVVEFVLHGGDMVDRMTEGNVRAACRLFRLPVPVFLCLGNHDLTDEASLETWLKLAPQFFPGGDPNYTIATDECVIHVVPNQWCEQPYLWQGKQTAHFLPGQTRRLKAEIAQRPDLPHLILTHSPVLGLPTEQTGFDAPYHGTTDAFRNAMQDLARRHPQTVCILGAHSHLNMSVERDGCHYVTVSALTEAPFEFKLFDIARDRIEMTTISLAGAAPFPWTYDFNKTFVQGRPNDRAFIRRMPDAKPLTLSSPSWRRCG